MPAVPSELNRLGFAEVAALNKSGRLSPVEWVWELLDRIAALDARSTPSVVTT
jgi:hypothetical protein